MTGRAASPRRPVRTTGVVAFALVLVVVAGAVAQAAWSATGTGAASAASTTLTPPSAPTVARQPVDSSTVQVSWAGVPVATTYDVTRHTSADATDGGTVVCPSVSVTSCADTLATSSQGWYRVTARRDGWGSGPGAAAHVGAVAVAIPLSFTSCPATVTHNQNYSTRIARPAVDASGNDVTATAVTVTLTASGNAASSTGSVTIPAGATQSPQFTVRVNGNGQTGSVRAEASGHAAVTCTMSS